MKLDHVKLLKNLLKSNRPIDASNKLYNIKHTTQNLTNKNGLQILPNKTPVTSNKEGLDGTYFGTKEKTTPASTHLNLEGIENSELAALKQYMSGESYILNDKLRRNIELTPHQQRLTTQLDSALNKMPNYDKPTYRDITFDLFGQESYNDFIKQHKIGNIVTYPAYTSTSKSINGYPIDENAQKVAKMIIEGKNGKSVATHGIVDEQEVLFKRNSKFQVLNSQVNKNGISYFYLKETD